ncbi:polyprenyl synthetase family protein [Actinomadura verrucosospora]|uniref:Octaprenyl-diphosphate synthase n=1 Tax=Actinomadura verrucosospora TaxID=46165 RepID=A0A7D3VWQ4_ACTVE|nr:polyprenyl synthetase family protein [Actinomadura verrucosospora]QKG25093.1 octaprenyl-diphosphate synthase [Actinomadura verrucosospora]
MYGRHDEEAALTHTHPPPAGSPAGSPGAPAPEERSRAVERRLLALCAELSAPLAASARALVERPGKRLRSALVSACARLGPADPERVARFGAVVELLHIASLLHDDIVDRAETRRGGPAAHTVVGSARASLAGLACFALAGQEAADLGRGAATLASRAAAHLSYGEILDVERAFDTAFPIADYRELVERKTGDLFGLCCALGALEAGADADVVRAVERFGREFGVAFQIADDCLDFAGAPGGSSGGPDKPAGTDHLLGLFGAPTLFALARDTTGELAALLLSPAFSLADMPAVGELVRAYGGLTEASALAAVHRDRAVAALEDVPDPAVRDELLRLTSLAGKDGP